LSSTNTEIFSNDEIATVMNAYSLLHTKNVVEFDSLRISRINRAIVDRLDELGPNSLGAIA
jgi:hypothetical protein